MNPTTILVLGNGRSKPRGINLVGNVNATVSANMAYPQAEWLATVDAVGLLRFSEYLKGVSRHDHQVATSTDIAARLQDFKADVVVDLDSNDAPILERTVWSAGKFHRGRYMDLRMSGVFAVQFALNFLGATRLIVAGLDGYDENHHMMLRQDLALKAIVAACPEVEFSFLYGAAPSAFDVTAQGPSRSSGLPA